MVIRPAPFVSTSTRLPAPPARSPFGSLASPGRARRHYVAANEAAPRPPDSSVSAENRGRLLQERIGRALRPDRGCGPVSADDGDIARQREELVADRLDELCVIGSGQVGAADRTREQHVADDRQALRRIEKGSASRRMPRTVPDVELQFADLGLISVLQPSVGRDVLTLLHAKAAGTLG